MFFEIARFASILRPRYLFLENVVGLLTHDGGATFATILGAMDELGYNVEWQVFNSKNFGVPQNRERVFIVGHLRGEGTKPIFPFGSSVSEHNSEPKINILGNTKNPDGTGFGTRSLVYDSNGVVGALTATDYKGAKQVAIHLDNAIKVAGKLPMSHDQNSRVYDPNGLAPTLSTMQGGGQEPKIRVKEATTKGYSEAEVGDSINISHPNSKTRRGRVVKKLANTLLTGETQAVVAPGFKIRKLTPRECWRLQGFPDWAFDRAQQVNSNSQLYKQAGNSVTVPVIAAIAKRLGG